MNYRGPVRQAYGSLNRNDEMREGQWTVVVVVSGEGSDRMNDSNVEVGFYNSPDPLVKQVADGLLRQGEAYAISRRSVVGVTRCGRCAEGHGIGISRQG